MNEDKIIQKLIEHDEKLELIEEKMATKQDIRDIRTTMDEDVVILKRLDQERSFDTEWIRRVEKNTEDNTKEIKQMKQKLGFN